MTSCPAGHDSAATDYCDVCGTPMTRDGLAAAPAAVATPAQRCANCGETRHGRFCEVCGHDAAKPADPIPAVAGPGEWSALVQADRSWFEEVRSRNGPDVAILEFPRYCRNGGTSCPGRG